MTRAVGMYQARPLSVVDVTARRWRPAGSVGPIRVSREFNYLGALLRGGSSNGLYPNYSVRVQLVMTLSEKLTSIGPTSMARATPWVSTRQGQVPGTDTCYQASWHCGRWAKQSVSVPVRGRSRRPSGQLALGQVGKVAGPGSYGWST